MTFGRLQVQPGMQVVGTGATPVGQVAEVHSENFRVVRAGGEDLYVPYEAIRAMLGEQVVPVVVRPAGQEHAGTRPLPQAAVGERGRGRRAEEDLAGRRSRLHAREV